MDFATFKAAIIGQESGGNYRAVNPSSGALGYSQIMPGNIIPWSLQYLGFRITPTEFLHSPRLQELLTTAVLRSYFIKYGPRGAAAAWYSGDYRKANNYNPIRNGPSIGSYVDQVLGRTGGDAPAYSHINVSTNVSTKNIDRRTKQSDWNALFGSQLPKDSPIPAGIESADKAGALTAAAGSGVGTEAATGGTGMEKPGEVPTLVAPKAGPPAAAPGVTEDQKWLSGTATFGQRAAMIEVGKQFIGVPYVWGGSNPRGFDCSGLVQYVMKSIGISFPRVSWQQLKMGPRVGLGALKPGDLVGFRDGDHVAIYLGGGKILEAPRTGLDVRIRSLSRGENAWGVSLDKLFR